MINGVSQDQHLIQGALVRAQRDKVMTTKIQPALVTRQELSGRSILRNYLYNRDLIANIDLLKKGLANVCLGASCQGAKKLEGMPFADAMILMVSLFKNLDKQQLFSQGQPLYGVSAIATVLKADLCDEESTPKQKANEALRKIAGLKPGQKHYMPTGWGVLPAGHAMIISIYRREDELLDISIFNAQGGTEEVQGGIECAGKTRCVPYIKFEAVRQEKLFLTEANGRKPSALIFENIYALMNPKLSTDNFSWNTVLGFFAPISDYLSTGDRSLQLLTMVQRSGKCTIKAFLCAMLEDFRDIPQCKRVHLDLRFDLIVSGYYALVEAPPQDKGQLAFMLRQATTTFLGMLKRNVNRVDRESFLTGVATAEEILDYVDAYTRKQIEPKALDRVVLPNPSDQIEAEGLSRQRALSSLTIEQPAQAAAVEQPFVKSSLGDVYFWKDLKACLDLAVKAMPGLSQQDKIIQLDLMFNNLSFVKSSKIDSLSFEQTIVILNCGLTPLFNCYIEAVKNAQCVTSPTTHNTLLEMIAMAYLLACHADRLRKYGLNPGYLSQFGLDLFLFKDAGLANGYDSHEPKVLDQRNRLVRFFRPLEDKRILFEFLKSSFNKDDVLSGKLPEANYYLSVVPELQASSDDLRAMGNLEAAQKVRERADELLKLFGAHSTKRGPPVSKELPHFFALKWMALCCAELAVFVTATAQPELTSNYSFCCGDFVYHYGQWILWKQPQTKEQLQQLRETFGASKENRLEAYTETDLATHDASMISSEGQYIVQKSGAIEDVCLDRSLRGMAEPDVTIAVLLQEWAARPDLFEDYRRFNVHLLHKTLETNGGTYSPLFQEIKEDGNFLARVNLFTAAIYQKWHAKIGLGKVLEEIDTIMIVLWLRAELVYYFSDLRSKELLDPDTLYWNQQSMDWLDEIVADIEQDVDLPLSVHCDLLSVKAMFLLSMPVTQRTPAQWAALFHTMTKARSLNLNSSYFPQTYRRYLKSLPVSLPKDIPAFAKELVLCLGGDSALTSAKSYGYRVDAEKLGLTKWSFDLEALTISVDGQPWSEGKVTFEKEGLARLFGDRPIRYQVHGNDGLVFRDSIWGMVRLGLTPFPERKIKRIEREIDNEWYTYFAPNTANILLNLSLVYDHVLWVKNDQSAFVIQDLQNGQTLFTSFGNGLVRSLEGLIFSSHESKTHPVAVRLEKFENAEQICFWFNEQKQVFRLPRFSPPLNFHYKDGEWLYSGNPHFYLDLQTKMSWGIDQTIDLVDAEGKNRLVLVPVGIISSESFTPTCSIELPASRDLSRGSLEFEEFEVVGQDLKARSLNGKIYLAHLYLAQKQYHKAVVTLREISLTEQPDVQSWKRLKALLARADKSPKAAAVRLIAYALVKRLKPYADSVADYNDSVRDDTKVYENTPHQIDEGLTLTKSEELEIAQFKSSSNVERRFLWPKPSWWNPVGSSQAPSSRINLPISLDFQNMISSYNNRESGFAEAKRWMETRSPRFIQKYKDFSRLKADQIVPHAYLTAYETGIERTERSVLVLVLQMVQNGMRVPDFSPADFVGWCGALYAFVVKNKIRVVADPDYWNAMKCNVPTLETRSTDIKSPDGVPSILQMDMIPEFEELKRDKALAELSTSYLKAPPEIQPEVFVPEWVLDEKALTAVEARYLPAIQHHIEHYHKDRVAAREKFNQRYTWADASFETLNAELAKQIDESSKREAWLRNLVTKLANRLPLDLYQLAMREAEDLSRAKPQVSIKAACRAAAQSDWEARLRRLNSTLDEEDLKTLRSAALEYMMEVTHSNHINNIHKAVGKALMNPDEAVQKEEVVELLKMQREYDPLYDTFSLLIEFTSGLRIRGIQLKIIRDAFEAIRSGQFGYVFQLIMNGGKSSVILSTLMELFFDQGLIPAMVCQTAQFASAQGNMRAFQKDRYEKDIINFDATISELNDPVVLKDLLGRLDRAKRECLPLLMKSTFVQILQAKFQLEALRVTENSPIPERMVLLDQLLTRLETEVIGLLDEVDGTLSMKFAVHIPWGDPKTLPTDESGVIRDIYKTLMTEELQPHARLCKNEQEDLTHKAYREKVLPKLIDHFVVQGKQEIGIPEELNEAYRRFLQDTIESADQKLADSGASVDDLPAETAENVLLLRFIAKSLRSDNKVVRRRTQLIGLFRFFTSQVLPLALSLSYNRHYGASQAGDGEIIPYIGVGEGGLRKFGFPYLALALHLQSAFPGEVEENEIAYLAQQMTIAAQKNAPSDDLSYLATVEAVQFKKLTGITLLEAKEKPLLKKAHKFVNATEKTRLAVRTQIAPFHVRYFDEEASCTANDLIKRFRNVIGCSATVRPPYPRELGQPHLETGTEGSVLNLIEQDKPIPIIEIPNTSLQSQLNLIKNHPEKNSIRALIDSAAFLKTASSNQAVAAEILKELHHVEAVLFLPSGSDRFVLLVREGNVTHELASTRLDEIEKHKIPLNKIFVLFDDLRTIGTDIPMAPDTVCIQTLEPRLHVSKHEQGLFRARQAFQNQKIIPVMTAQGKAELFNQGKTLLDLTHTEIKNQAVSISSETLTSYSDQMHGIYRMKILGILRDAVRKNDSAMIVNTAKEHRSALVSKRDFSPYEDWLRIGTEEETIEVLQKRANENSDLQPLVDLAAEDPYLPHKVMKPFRQQVDHQIQLEQEVAMELQQVHEQNELVERELQQELQSYQISDIDDWYKEKEYNSFEWVWKNSVAVSDFLEQDHKNGSVLLDTSDYAAIFPKNLRLTDNLRYAATHSLPIFHRNFKHAHFVLVEREGDQFQFALLSKHDGKRCKHFPARKDTWILGLDGIPFGKTLDPAPTDHPEVVKGLCYANLFNGNIDYLEQRAEVVAPLIQSHKDQCRHYLALKNGFDRKQLAKALKSSLMGVVRRSLDEMLGNNIVFSSRIKKLQQIYLNLRNADQSEISLLPPSQVPDIAPHQVGWLTTAAQLSLLPTGLLPNVTDRQLNLFTLKSHRHLIDVLPIERRVCLSLPVLKVLVEQEPLPPLVSATEIPDWLLRVLPRERYIEGTLAQLPDSKLAYLPQEPSADEGLKDRVDAYFSSQSPEELAATLPFHVPLLPAEALQKLTCDLHKHLFEYLSDRQLFELDPDLIKKDEIVQERLVQGILQMPRSELAQVESKVFQGLGPDRVETILPKLSLSQLSGVYSNMGIGLTFIKGCYNVISELFVLPFVFILNLANLLFSTIGIPFSAQARQEWWGSFSEIFKHLARFVITPVSMISHPTYVYLNCRLK